MLLAVRIPSYGRTWQVFGEYSRGQSCSRLRLKLLLRIFRALQTSRVHPYHDMRPLSMNIFFIFDFRQPRPQRAMQTSKKQHIHEELVIKLFGKYLCLNSFFFCFYSVSIMFWQNLSTRQIVIIKWNTIIRMDEVCKQLVFTKFGELRFYFFFTVL